MSVDNELKWCVINYKSNVDNFSFIPFTHPPNLTTPCLEVPRFRLCDLGLCGWGPGQDPRRKSLPLENGEKTLENGETVFFTEKLFKGWKRLEKGWKKGHFLDTFVVLKGSKRLFWILLRGCLLCFRGFRLSCCWCCWRFQAIFSNYDNNMYNGRWAAWVKIRWQQDHMSAHLNFRHKGTVNQGIDTWYYHETLRKDRGDTKNDDFWYICLPGFWIWRHSSSKLI